MVGGVETLPNYKFLSRFVNYHKLAVVSFFGHKTWRKTVAFMPRARCSFERGSCGAMLRAPSEITSLVNNKGLDSKLTKGIALNYRHYAKLASD